MTGAGLTASSGATNRRCMKFEVFKKKHFSRVHERYLKGESLATLAKEVGVSAPTLSSFMKRMGVSVRHPGCAADKPLYLYGLGGERLSFRSISEGARYFGVDRRTLLYRIARGEIRQYTPRVFRAHPGLDCMPDTLGAWKIFQLLKNKKHDENKTIPEGALAPSNL